MENLNGIENMTGEIALNDCLSPKCDAITGSIPKNNKSSRDLIAIMDGIETRVILAPRYSKKSLFYSGNSSSLHRNALHTAGQIQSKNDSGRGASTTTFRAIVRKRQNINYEDSSNLENQHCEKKRLKTSDLTDDHHPISMETPASRLKTMPVAENASTALALNIKSPECHERCFNGRKYKHSHIPGCPHNIKSKSGKKYDKRFKTSMTSYIDCCQQETIHKEPPRIIYSTRLSAVIDGSEKTVVVTSRLKSVINSIDEAIAFNLRKNNETGKDQTNAISADVQITDNHLAVPEPQTQCTHHNSDKSLPQKTNSVINSINTETTVNSPKSNDPGKKQDRSKSADVQITNEDLAVPEPQNQSEDHLPVKILRQGTKITDNGLDESTDVNLPSSNETGKRQEGSRSADVQVTNDISVAVPQNQSKHSVSGKKLKRTKSIISADEAMALKSLNNKEKGKLQGSSKSSDAQITKGKSAVAEPQNQNKHYSSDKKGANTTKSVIISADEVMAFKLLNNNEKGKKQGSSNSSDVQITKDGSAISEHQKQSKHHLSDKKAPKRAKSIIISADEVTALKLLNKTKSGKQQGRSKLSDLQITNDVSTISEPQNGRKRHFQGKKSPKRTRSMVNSLDEATTRTLKLLNDERGKLEGSSKTSDLQITNNVSVCSEPENQTKDNLSDEKATKRTKSKAVSVDEVTALKSPNKTKAGKQQGCSKSSDVQITNDDSATSEPQNRRKRSFSGKKSPLRTSSMINTLDEATALKSLNKTETEKHEAMSKSSNVQFTNDDSELAGHHNRRKRRFLGKKTTKEAKNIIGSVDKAAVLKLVNEIEAEKQQISSKSADVHITDDDFAVPEPQNRRKHRFPGNDSPTSPIQMEASYWKDTILPCLSCIKGPSYQGAHDLTCPHTRLNQSKKEKSEKHKLSFKAIKGSLSNSGEASEWSNNICKMTSKSPLESLESLEILKKSKQIIGGKPSEWHTKDSLNIIEGVFYTFPPGDFVWSTES